MDTQKLNVKSAGTEEKKMTKQFKKAEEELKNSNGKLRHRWKI